MMQIQFIALLKVIFVLSTIVAVTDCCSSRILLLREHTLKIVQHQHNFHNHLHEHAHQLQQQIEQHVVQLVNQMELHKQLNVQQTADGQTIAADTSQTPLNLQDMDVAVATTTEFNNKVDSIENWTVSASTAKATDEPLIADSSTQSLTFESSSTTESSTAYDVTSSTQYTASSNKSIELDISISENTIDCSEIYKTSFCENGGRCFQYTSHNWKWPSCWCADGYIGERCESKNINGVYVHTTLAAQPKILMARVVICFPMLILLSVIYVIFGAVFIFRNVSEQRREQQQQETRLRSYKQRLCESC